MEEDKIIRQINDLATDYIEKYCHPHTTIEINEDGLKIKEDLLFLPNEHLIHDDKDETYQVN